MIVCEPVILLCCQTISPPPEHPPQPPPTKIYWKNNTDKALQTKPTFVGNDFTRRVSFHSFLGLLGLFQLLGALFRLKKGSFNAF